MRERNENIDAVRGGAIILVVLGHVIQYIYAPADYENNIVYNIIYSFHMPLFMFLSGYLAYRTDRELDKTWIKKRFCALVIPYVVWIILAYFLEGYAGEGKLFEWFRDGVLYVTNGAPWFLWVLFLNCIVLYVGTKLRKYVIKNDIVFVLLVIGVYSISYAARYFVGQYPLGLNLCAWQFAFYAAGYLTNQHAVLEKLSSKVNNVLLAVACMICWTWRFGGKPFFYETVLQRIASFGLIAILFKGLCLVYKYLVPFLWIFALYWIVKQMPEFKLKKCVGRIGEYTMEIYLLHIYILDLIKMSNVWVASMMALIFGTGVPILASNMLNRCSFIKKLMFGR